jgi:hypothetical protein
MAVNVEHPGQVEYAWSFARYRNAGSADCRLPKTVYEQSQVYSAVEEAALIDEVASIAYQERKRAGKPSAVNTLATGQKDKTIVVASCILTAIAR